MSAGETHPMAERDRDYVRTVPVRTLLSEVMLMLVEAGRRYLREHPDELASDPDSLALIEAGCRYLREHPEARTEIGLRAPGGPGRG